MLGFLRELVAISSETKDLGGVHAVQQKIHEKLSACGAEMSWLEPEQAGYAAGLLAAWPSIATNTQGVCLVSHADTVYAAEHLQEFQIDNAQGFARGGGVADNKGGLVVACGAIEKLHRAGVLGRNQRPLYLFSSSCEELGSPAFQKVIHDLSTRLSWVLGLEPALPNGNLIKKRRGNRYYLVSIHGNSVHTGRDLKEAANPLDGVALLHALFEKLRNQHPQVGISLNGIKGFPFKFNQNCEKIEINIDTRFENASTIHAFHDDFMREIKKLQFKSLSGKNVGSFGVELVDDCPAFDAGIPTADLLKLAVNYSEAEGKEVFFGDGLGSSDCCYFYREGLKIVDGLGPRGGKIHSPDEFIEIASLEQRAEGLAKFLAEILQR